MLSRSIQVVDNTDRRTLLMSAASTGNVEVMQLLIDKVEMMGTSGWMAHERAGERGSRSIQKDTGEYYSGCNLLLD